MARTGILLALTLALLAGVPGCRRQVSCTRAFCFWRTVFALSPGETQALRAHRIERLYLRLFDVVVDASSGGAAPVAECQMREPVPAGIEVVPVVFIANRVFEAQLGPEALAGKVWQRVRDFAAAAGLAFHELQVDCDGSDRTRKAFFAFCRALRSEAAVQSVRLGATTRLHQIKYASRTGIPPVDRGILMF
jgi:hypothetical protein